jgi:hypothetical protein
MTCPGFPSPPVPLITTSFFWFKSEKPGKKLSSTVLNHFSCGELTKFALMLLGYVLAKHLSYRLSFITSHEIRM